MSKTTIPLADAEQIARRLIDHLSPACRQIAIAGSIRRRKPEVGDIEIVCVPCAGSIVMEDLFGPVQPIPYSMLDDRLRDLKSSGILSPDPTTPRNGPKYKRFIVQDLDTPSGFVHIALDLFIADEHNYGNTLAIRTGDAEFSKALVTQRRVGGLMPSHLRQHDGYLWHGDERLSCPDEATFFRNLGLPAEIDPTIRHENLVRRLAREARMGER